MSDGEPRRYSREGFWSVLRGVWFSPARFFSGLDPEGGPIRSALFAIAVLFLNLILDTALQAFWTQQFNLALVYAPPLGLVASFLLAPLLVAGYTALSLLVLEGFPSAGGFGRLFRAFGYSTAAGVVLWLPYGPLVAIPLFCYAATTAVRQTLGVNWGKSAMAALIPLAALLLLFLLLLGPADMWRTLTNPAAA